MTVLEAKYSDSSGGRSQISEQVIGGAGDGGESHWMLVFFVNSFKNGISAVCSSLFHFFNFL